MNSEESANVDEQDVKELLDSMSGESIKQALSYNTYGSFSKRVDSLKARMKFSTLLYNNLLDVDKVIEIDVPVALDKKHRDKQVVRLFSGFRVEHNNILGPYKGGVRFSHGINLEDAKGIAAINTIRNALFELPFGGANGGVAADIKQLNRNEFDRLSRAYVRKLGRFLGVKKDISEADIGTSSRAMDIMAEELRKLTNDTDSEAGFSGKSAAYLGLKDRDAAASLGGFYILDEFLKKQEASQVPGAEYSDLLKKENKPLKVAIQGFGNVGRGIAKLLHEQGHRIIGVSDSTGGIASIQGIEPKNLERWKYRNKSVLGFEKTLRIKNEQLLSLNADILVLAAVENQVTEKNAHAIKAGIIVEFAPGAVSFAADMVLNNNGKIVVPDVLVNAGSAVVGYFEWLHDMQGRNFKSGEIEKLLQDRMLAAFNDVQAVAAQHALSFREAAYMLAINKLSEAMKDRK